MSNDQTGPQHPPFENVAGAYLDPRIMTFVIVTKDLLINQLKRDCPKIAVSFDEVIGDNLTQVSEVLAKTFTLVSPHIIGCDLTAKARDATCARLLSTALTTFIGCVHLARGGFRLQYATLSRSVVEMICTVLHLMVDPDANQKFHLGKLKSTNSVSAANKVLPVFGQLWGELSNQFVHITTMHSNPNPLVIYDQDDEAIDFIKDNMKVLSWLLFVTTELVFVDEIDHPRYWKIVNFRADGNEIIFDPSEAERLWQANFLGIEVG